MNFFGRGSEAEASEVDPRFVKNVDLLSLKNVADHPGLADVTDKLRAAKAKCDSINDALDRLVAAFDDEPKKAARNRRTLLELQQQKLDAEAVLADAQEQYAQAIEPIKAAIKQAWEQKARDIIDTFKPKLLELLKEHQPLIAHCRLGEQLGISQWITFQPFLETSGPGTDKASYWCAFVERELSSL